MKSALRRAGYTGLYFASWLLFGLGGLALNLACIPLLLLPRRAVHAARVRAAIRWLFDFWLRWLHMTGIVRIAWHGFDRPLAAGTVYVANHPSLVDAPFLLARLPDAVCIFKPALMRNPLLGPAAIMAGYAAGDTGVDLVREVAENIAAGRSLLVFPEGTRTAHGAAGPGPLRPGFALIAARAAAAVQLLVIRAPADLLPRGRAWWLPPAQLPIRLSISLDQAWPHAPGRSAAQLAGAVQQRLAAALAEPAPPLPR